MAGKLVRNGLGVLRRRRTDDAEGDGERDPMKGGAMKKSQAAKAAARTEADVTFVQALAKLLDDHNLTEIEVTREYGEADELTVRLTRASIAAAPAAVVHAPAAPAPARPAALPPADPHALPPPAAEGDADPSEHPGVVHSPMVGTIYLSPEPTAAQFVQPGDRVEEGQTLLIIEAMKTMNQIPSPRAGVVTKIFVSNEQPVEYGAPLLILE